MPLQLEESALEESIYFPGKEKEASGESYSWKYQNHLEEVCTFLDICNFPYLLLLYSLFSSSKTTTQVKEETSLLMTIWKENAQDLVCSEASLG